MMDGTDLAHREAMTSYIWEPPELRPALTLETWGMGSDAEAAQREMMGLAERL